MPRGGWGAHKPHGKLEPFKGPVDFLVVSQTNLNERCDATDACCRLVKKEQFMDMKTSKTKIILHIHFLNFHHSR